MHLVPDGVFTVSDMELRRYPPELRFVNTNFTSAKGPLDVKDWNSVIFQQAQLRHSAIQQLAIRGTIQSDAVNQTRVTGFDLVLQDLNFNFVGTIMTVRNNVAQAIFDDTSLVSQANGGFVATYCWNLRVPFIVPAGHQLHAFFRGWAAGQENTTHTIVATVGCISFPEGNLVR
jgi:hypothetical protein